MTAARSEHVVPGREIHMQDMRGHRFCEVGLITAASQGGAVANIWNTVGASDPEPEQVDALDADTIARENGVLRVWLNPVRHSMFDRLDVRDVGDDRTFGAINATWTGAADEAALRQATAQGSYNPRYIYCNNTLTFGKGSKVYLLDAPDGEVFILQSLSRHVDPDLSEAGLAHPGARLDLPAGWGFRTETLDQDLEVSSNADNLAHILHDDMHNAYQGSDAGRAFSRFCRPEERW